MKKLFLASAATVLLSASLAFADSPLMPNDNDHMAALGFAIERNAAIWSGRSGIEVVASTYRGGGVMMPSSAALRGSTNFLRYRATNGDNK